MTDEIPVLNTGFVRLESCMGSDLTVVNAARVSFGKRSESLTDADKRLIRYLADHKHWTPFAHPQVTFHIKLPIFVARQWMRSNVGVVWNEISRRYVDSEPEFYIPKVWRCRPTGGIKQGSGTKEIVPEPHGAGKCWNCGDPVSGVWRGRPRRYCSGGCAKIYSNRLGTHRVSRLKKRAEELDVPFDLSVEDVEWPEKCPVFGTELNYMGKGKGSCGFHPNSPSVDRLDSSLGYTPDNVAVISMRANAMKRDATRAELLQFARWVLLVFNGQIVPESGTYEDACKYAALQYRHLLDSGVAPEMARMILPQSVFTEVWGTFSLSAVHRICSLRLDPHAQWEIQQYAAAVDKIMTERFPISWAALSKGGDDITCKGQPSA